MSDPLRVVLADDSVLLREGLARLLEESGFEVAASPATPRTCSARSAPTARTSPSSTCGCRPRTPTRACAPRTRSAPTTRASACSCSPSTSRRPTRSTCCRSRPSAPATCSRTASPTSTTFTDAVRRVAGGGSALDPEVVALLLGRRRREDPLEALTPREREVLGLMAEGRSNAAIAAALVVTERAVEKHVTVDLHQARPHARRGGSPAGARRAAVPAVALTA